MRYEWDEAKNRANRAKHGIGFEMMEQFEWGTAVTFIDDREDYGEQREIAIGFLGMSLHTVVFVEIDGDLVHVISLRKSSKKEKRRYVDETQ